MSLRQDEQAASPLVVLSTFVAAAILLTAGAYWLFFDRPEPSLSLVEERDGDALAYNVTATTGSLHWGDVTLHWLDRAGTDQAAHFLHAPNGTIATGQRIVVQPLPPAGAYVLLVVQDGHDLARIVTRL